MQITFRGMKASPAMQFQTQEKLDKLQAKHPQLKSCHVIIEAPHNYTKGGLFSVHLDISVPGKHLAVSRDCDQAHDHEDAHTTLRDAFAAADRQLASTHPRHHQR
jgi:ribosome-associated translation inhibitor RaiA